MLRKTLLVVTLIGYAAVVLLFLGCGDPDYQEDWLGSWRDTDSGLIMTFNEDGTFSARAEVQGVTVNADSAGKYTVQEHTYTLTLFANQAFGVQRRDDRGTWERKGDRIELQSDDEGLITLRKIEE